MDTWPPVGGKGHGAEGRVLAEREHAAEAARLGIAPRSVFQAGHPKKLGLRALQVDGRRRQRLVQGPLCSDDGEDPAVLATLVIERETNFVPPRRTQVALQSATGTEGT